MAVSILWASITCMASVAPRNHFNKFRDGSKGAWVSLCYRGFLKYRLKFCVCIRLKSFWMILARSCGRCRPSAAEVS